MQPTVSDLHSAISQVCPNIQGVSVGRWDDKTTWRVDFKDNATAAERDAAYKIIEVFGPKDVHEPDMGRPEVLG